MTSLEISKTVFQKHLAVLMHHFPESDTYNLITAAKKTSLMEAEEVKKAVIDVKSEDSKYWESFFNEIIHHIQKM